MSVPLAASGSSGSYLPLLLIVVLFGVMYLFMIRPQQRRQREVQALQASMGAGDEVMTSSGVYGTIVAIDDDATVQLEVAPGVTIRVARQAIMKVVTQAHRDIDDADEADFDDDDAEPDDATSDEPVEQAARDEG